MKKGIISLDAFLAIIIMSFIVIMLQNFFNMNFDNTQEFGAQSMANAEAIKVGSMMNTFFAGNPSATDYMELTNTVPLFGENIIAIVVKQQGDTNVTVSLLYGGMLYNASYPVVAQINYDPVTQKVTA